MVRHSEKKAAVINLGAGPSQISLIKKAREMGFTVVSVDRDKEASGFRHSDINLNLSTHDADGVIRELEKISEEYYLCGVLARTTGQALYTASCISRIFSLSGINDTIARISTEKSSMREFLKSHNFAVPVGRKMSPNDLGKLDIPLPVIVKPDFTMMGKKDIYLVTDKHSLDRCVIAAGGSSQNKCAEIERYIEGIDVSCMFFANKGDAKIIAFWDELVAVMNDGTISGLGISTPSVTYGTVAEENMKKIVHEFASLFPEVAAILVLSFRIDFQGSPHVIELHADLTGDLILDILLPASCEGFDPWALILEVATDGICQFPSGECIPTTLYYSSEKFDLTWEHGLIQETSLTRNIETFTEILGTTSHNMAYPPKHLEWLLQNTGGKEVST